MAEESLIKEESSGEEFLRREADIMMGFVPGEVAELPTSVKNMQIKMERLRREIANLQTQFDNVRDEMGTRIAAFNWYNEQVQEALKPE